MSIQKYLDEKKQVWSDSTHRSERARMVLVSSSSQDPAGLYKKMIDEGYGLYSIKTALVRLADYLEYENPGKPNAAKEFLQKNRRLFLNAYTHKTPELSFKEAKNRILTLKDKDIQEKALQLLTSGMRWNESFTLDSQNNIVGKGGKIRKVFIPAKVDYTKSYTRFWRAMKTIGLTPHTLRKLAATELVARGLNEFDLCKVFGWSSIETARNYVAPKKDSELKKMFEELE